MNNYDLNQYDPMNDLVDSEDFYTKTDNHLRTTPGVIRQIPHNDIAEVRKNVFILGNHCAADSRIESLAEYAESRWNEAIKYILNIAIGSMGALVLGSGAALILGSSGRGVLGTVGGAMSGGVLAVLGDNMLTQQITKKRCHKEAKKALANVEKQQNNHQPQTEFTDAYFQGQTDVISRVEGNHLDDVPLWEMVIAMSLNGAEGLVSFFLLLPGGLPMALAGAAFPIAVSLALAKTQSDHFDYPDCCDKQIEKYKAHLIKEQITASQALSITEVDETIKFVSSRRADNPDSSVQQAKALGRIQFCSKRISAYQSEMADKVKSLEGEFFSNRSEQGHLLNQGLKQLNNEFQDALVAIKSGATDPSYSYQEPDVRGLPIDEGEKLLQEHRRQIFESRREALHEDVDKSILQLSGEYSFKKDTIVEYYRTRIAVWERLRQDAEDALNQGAHQ
jgi:hypothetical protein